MSDLKGVAILAMQAMLSSKHVSDYINDGSEGHGDDLSRHDAVAKEAFKYAEAFEKEAMNHENI